MEHERVVEDVEQAGSESDPEDQVGIEWAELLELDPATFSTSLAFQPSLFSCFAFPGS